MSSKSSILVIKLFLWLARIPENFYSILKFLLISNCKPKCQTTFQNKEFHVIFLCSKTQIYYLDQKVKKKFFEKFINFNTFANANLYDKFFLFISRQHVCLFRIIKQHQIRPGSWVRVSQRRRSGSQWWGQISSKTRYRRGKNIQSQRCQRRNILGNASTTQTKKVRQQ